MKHLTYLGKISVQNKRADDDAIITPLSGVKSHRTVLHTRRIATNRRAGSLLALELVHPPIITSV